MFDFDSNCPWCLVGLTVSVKRWNTKTICPKCDGKILVDFDMIVGDDYDEWDIHSLKKLVVDSDFYDRWLEITKCEINGE